jgi:hypothetical protein
LFEGHDVELTRLRDAAISAGQKLFGRDLTFTEPDETRHQKLSQLDSEAALGADEDYGEPPSVDTWAYAFFPSTGDGLDVSAVPWADATEDWTDSDGRIYIYQGELIRVITPDRPLKPSDPRWKRNVSGERLGF